MTIKRATLIFLAGIAVLIAIVVIAPQTLPPELFGKEGLLATRYKFAFQGLIFLLYVAPLIILMTVLIGARAKLSLKWAALILLVSSTLFIAGVPFMRSILPPEYLADSGIKAALYKIIGFPLGMLLLLAPIGIFLNALMEAGKDKKAPNHQGLFDLRTKAGPRWLAAIYGGAGGVIIAYVAIYARVDFSGANMALLTFLLACVAILIGTIWNAIFVALLRVRYDDERIIATTLLFRQREHSWSGLLKIKDMHFSDGKCLFFRNTGTAHIEEYLEGYNDLMEHANKVLNDA